MVRRSRKAKYCFRPNLSYVPRPTDLHPLGSFCRIFWVEIVDSPSDRRKKCLFLFQNIAMQYEIIKLAIFSNYALFRTCRQKKEIFTSKFRPPEKIRSGFCEQRFGIKRKSRYPIRSTAESQAARWSNSKCCNALFVRRWSLKEIQMH